MVVNIGGGDNSKPVDLSGVKVYKDAMDLIADPGVEVVDICVPTSMHMAYALAALKSGKHVFCEKATLKLDSTGFNIFLKNGKKVTPKLDVKNGPTGWHQELAYFVDCIRKGVRPTKYQTIDSVADTMKMIFAVEKSAKARKTVKI